jgi:hypothetical protein
MKYMIGSGFSTEIHEYEWVLVFKNIEYVNGGCFKNLSGTFVPKSIGKAPHPPRYIHKGGIETFGNR